jgi:hypothetical protein
MFASLGVSGAVRGLGLVTGAQPPTRAATLISLMIFVNILPRLASAALFLCFMEAHLLWPDILYLSFAGEFSTLLIEVSS